MSTTEIGRNLIHRINVGDSLTRSAWRRPEALALVDGDRRFTYREFNNWVNRVSHGLHRHGLRSGDALALASGNCAEFPRHLLRLRETGARVRSDQSWLGHRRNLLRA